MSKIDLHLISDATGETILSVARACMVQFEDIETVEHLWPMVRSQRQLEHVISEIEEAPGFVMYTLVDGPLGVQIQDACRRLQVPCVSVLDPIIGSLGAHLGTRFRGRPGMQHVMDSDYFERIDAMNFVLSHDDGQAAHTLDEADVVLVGVSRTSKTPTCIYLANRGIKAANIPVVPGIPVPEQLLNTEGPLIVGLTNDPTRLVQVRRNRLKMLNEHSETDYTDIESVRAEVTWARRMFAENKWPVIDVTRRSIEETAADIVQLYQHRDDGSAM